MSFGTAGYVIFLPQRLVIDSAAGTGRGLPAWHRNLPGVLGALGGHHSLPGVPAVLGEQTPQSAPLHPPAWQETPALITQMLPWRKGSETPGNPQHPRAGPWLPRDEVSSPRDWAVVGGPRELAQPWPAGVARAKSGSKRAGNAGLIMSSCRPWAKVQRGVRQPSSICWSRGDGRVWAGQGPPASHHCLGRESSPSALPGTTSPGHHHGFPAQAKRGRSGARLHTGSLFPCHQQMSASDRCPCVGQQSPAVTAGGARKS